MSKGKKYIDSVKLIDSTKQYDPDELVAELNDYFAHL